MVKWKYQNLKNGFGTSGTSLYFECEVVMIRIDALHKNQKDVENYLKKQCEPGNGSDIKYYILSNENKAKDGTEHQQGALILDAYKDAKLTAKEVSKIRNYYNLQDYVKNPTGKNKVAISPAKIPQNLLKYSNDKEGKGMVTNMPEWMLNQIGKWKDKDKEKKLLKEELIKLYVSESKKTHRPLLKIEIIMLATQLAIKMEKKPPPIKTLYFYAQLANVLTPQQVASYSYGYEYLSAQQEYENSQFNPSNNPYSPCEFNDTLEESDDEA